MDYPLQIILDYFATLGLKALPSTLILQTQPVHV